MQFTIYPHGLFHLSLLSIRNSFTSVQTSSENPNLTKAMLVTSQMPIAERNDEISHAKKSYFTFT